MAGSTARLEAWPRGGTATAHGTRGSSCLPAAGGGAVVRSGVRTPLWRGSSTSCTGDVTQARGVATGGIVATSYTGSDTDAAAGVSLAAVKARGEMICNSKSANSPHPPTADVADAIWLKARKLL